MWKRVIQWGTSVTGGQYPEQVVLFNRVFPTSLHRRPVAGRIKTSAVESALLCGIAPDGLLLTEWWRRNLYERGGWRWVSLLMVQLLSLLHRTVLESRGDENPDFWRPLQRRNAAFYQAIDPGDHSVSTPRLCCYGKDSLVRSFGQAVRERKTGPVSLKICVPARLCMGSTPCQDC